MATEQIPDTRIRQSRVALVVFFSGVGILAGTLVSRVPSVRDDLGVTPSQFGTVLLVGALGGILAFAFTGGLVGRFGPRAVGRACAVAIVLAVLVMAAAMLAALPWAYGLGLFLALAAFEILMATLSAEAATIERLIGRPILSQFHAAFSIAMLVGLGLGAAYSYAGVSASAHFAINGLVVGAAFLAASGRAFLEGRPRSGEGGARPDFFAGIKAAVRERRTIALGFILLCAFTTEAAAGNWIPLALVDDYDRTEATASVMYASVILAQSVTRVTGVKALERLGRVRTLRASAVLIIAGVLVFAFSPVLWAVAVALVVWGVGTAFAFPVALSAAADERTNATARVAAVNVFATAGGLVTPLLIGVLAEVVEIRRAILLVCVAAVAIFVLAPVTRAPGSADAASARLGR